MPGDPENPEQGFSSEIEIVPEELSIEPFFETRRVRGFSCGVKELDDFLNAEEVVHYEKEMLGKTSLVFYRGEFIAYFTLSFGSLKIEMLQTHKSFSRLHYLHIQNIPALTLGRLGVSQSWQGKGIGRMLMKYITGLALSQEHIATRLIILEAKNQAFDFYKKMGFEFTTETKNEKKKQLQRGTRTMFFDLDVIRSKPD